MNLSEKISWLRNNIGECIKTKSKKKFFKWTYYWSKGWISFYDKGKVWFCLLTTHETYNQRMDRNAYGIDVNKADGYRYTSSFNPAVYESAITMHFVHDEERAAEIWVFLEDLINDTYEYYSQRLNKGVAVLS